MVGVGIPRPLTWRLVPSVGQADCSGPGVSGQSYGGADVLRSDPLLAASHSCGWVPIGECRHYGFAVVRCWRCPEMLSAHLWLVLAGSQTSPHVSRETCRCSWYSFAVSGWGRYVLVRQVDVALMFKRVRPILRPFPRSGNRCSTAALHKCQRTPQLGMPTTLQSRTREQICLARALAGHMLAGRRHLQFM